MSHIYLFKYCLNCFQMWASIRAAVGGVIVAVPVAITFTDSVACVFKVAGTSMQVILKLRRTVSLSFFKMTKHDVFNVNTNTCSGLYL